MKYLKNPKLILILIVLLGAFLRFYKLDWGDGLFAHPDEYHISISVNQLSFPDQMHPHFFSYGTVVIYLVYFTKELTPNLNPFLIGRFYSALFSTLTILVVYFISKLILEKKYSLIVAFLVALTPGLIQQAHFATPESTLTFFIFSTLLFFLYFIKNGHLKDLVISSVFLGLGLGTKIIASLFFPVLFLGILIKSWGYPLNLIKLYSISLVFTFITFLISSPYIFLDYPAWRNSFNYENSVARGTLIVFYTRQFIDTYPLLFQARNILPYVLGPVLTIYGFFGLIFLFFHAILKSDLKLIIVLLTFLFFFLPNSLLFAKWTRFIAPTFPFFAIFAVYLINIISRKYKDLSFLLLVVLLIATGIYSLAFFSIYLKTDIRISANNWIETNLSLKDTYLVEEGNTIDLPLSGSKITVNFYNLESDPAIQQKIIHGLVESDYFIIQSRRVYYNHKRLPNLYPKTSNFYDNLFGGQLGFQKIKEVTSFPAIGIEGFKVEFPDEGAEETWSVFDHPVIRIYKKNVQYSREDYAKILED